MTNGGDIDNRVKVLKVPRECNEIPKEQGPEKDEEPFFCLLEDDSLITKVAITTDRLLTPTENGE
jgi:hypothetical protein